MPAMTSPALSTSSTTAGEVNGARAASVRSGESTPTSTSSSSGSSSLELRPGHFFQDMSLDTLNSVEEAIDSCKKAVLDTRENSDARKELVNKLIRLRIRYYDLKQRLDWEGGSGASGLSPDGVLEARGHSFVHYSRSTAASIPWTTQSAGRKVYCEHCAAAIWFGLQSSRHCRHCGYSVHSACIEGVVRPCVAEKARSQPDYILTLCPEKSLPRLKYRCVECDARLSRSGDPSARGEPRLCDYTGLSFCGGCHWDVRCVIPARVVRNWDFEPRPVSQVRS